MGSVSQSLLSEVPLIKKTLPEQISFYNFSREIVLIEQQDGYQVQANGQRVFLSNRLIVKTRKDIFSDKLYGQHEQVTRVTDLFKGKNSDYYLLEVKDREKLSQVLKEFQRMSGIELVQPDILQLERQAIKNTNLSLAKQHDKHVEETKRAARKARRAARIKVNKLTKNKVQSPYIDILNLESIWTKTKGKGVKIAIIDDGFNLKHEDLQHLSPAFSYDTDSGKFDTMPDHHRDSHGTKVAGIIFAAHDQKGIDGIAPEAQIIALRQPDTWTSKTIMSFQLAKLAGASIVNCSWQSNWLLQPINDIVDELAKHGREGKGIAVVFAAGNEGKKILPESIEASIESAIVVGAQNARYERLRSSNYGNTVDVMVYGGKAQTTITSGKYGIFSASSLAASIISGLSALILSQDPDMSLDELTKKLQLHTKRHHE